MPQEIERSFLISKIPPFLKCSRFEGIAQGYFEIGKDGREVRLRYQGNKYSRTIKTGDGMIRNEKSEEISKEEFEKNWPLTEGRRLEKCRFYLPIDGYVFEWDIYYGHLEGLMTIEVVFESKEKADAFIPPEWFGEEVTNDKNFRNYNLARWAYPTPEIIELRKKRDELWAKSKEKKTLLKMVRISCQLESIQDQLDEFEGNKPSERYYLKIRRK